MNPLNRIRCYDNGGKTADRYTVVYLDCPENAPGMYWSIGMDSSPFHPHGFGQHGAAMLGRHLGKRIRFADLPEDCRQCVRQDLGLEVSP